MMKMKILVVSSLMLWLCAAAEKSSPETMIKAEKSNGLNKERGLFFWITTPQPTPLPTPSPSKAPTKPPTEAPTKSPTDAPSESPTKNSSEVPTKSPTKAPSKGDSDDSDDSEKSGNPPTSSPTNKPSASPSKEPTKSPTKEPTNAPTKAPSNGPTAHPTQNPSFSPSQIPSRAPTKSPTPQPTPAQNPETTPKGSSNDDTPSPTESPTTSPSEVPSASPIMSPSALPSASPSTTPSTTVNSSQTAQSTQPPKTTTTASATALSPCDQLSQTNQTPTSSLTATVSIQYQIFTKKDSTQSQPVIQSLQTNMKYELASSMLKCNSTKSQRSLRQLSVLGMDYSPQTKTSTCPTSTAPQANFPFCTMVSQDITLYLEQDTPTKDRLTIVNDALSDVKSTFDDGTLNNDLADGTEDYKLNYVSGSVVDIAGQSMADVQDKQGSNPTANNGNNIVVASAVQGMTVTNKEGESGSVTPLAMGLGVGAALCAFLVAGLLYRKKRRAQSCKDDSNDIPLAQDDNLTDNNNGNNKKNRKKEKYESRIDPSWTERNSSLDADDSMDDEMEEDLDRTFASTPSSSPRRSPSYSSKPAIAHIIHEEQGEGNDIEASCTIFRPKTGVVRVDQHEREGGTEDIEMSIPGISQRFNTTSTSAYASSNPSTCQNRGPIFRRVDEINPEEVVLSGNDDVSVLSSRISSRDRSYPTNDTVDL